MLRLAKSVAGQNLRKIRVGRIQRAALQVRPKQPPQKKRQKEKLDQSA
jgi:hypothetical protein